MNKKSIVVFLFLLSVLNGYSQISWNAKAGMNVSKVTNFSVSNMKPGYQFGVGIDYYFTDSWGIQPSLMIIRKGDKYRGDIGGRYHSPDLDDFVDKYQSYNVTENRMYLQMPVMLAYRLNLSNTMKLVFNGGGYLSYGIGGKTNYTLTLKNGSSESTKGNTFYAGRQKIDFGFGTGTVLELKNRYTIGLFGEWGLKDAHTNRSSNRKNANHTYGLNIGYKF